MVKPPSNGWYPFPTHSLKSWDRNRSRKVRETRTVHATSNARKTLGAVEFTTKTEPTPMIFWFWTRPAINATPWCSRWRLSRAARFPGAEGASHFLAPRKRGRSLRVRDDRPDAIHASPHHLTRVRRRALQEAPLAECQKREYAEEPITSKQPPLALVGEPPWRSPQRRPPSQVSSSTFVRGAE